MTQQHFHTIIIGAGSGGMTVAIGLAGLGKKVALVEAHHVGGDCTNVGCVPSKTLIHLSKQFSPGDDPDAVIQEVIRKRDALRDKETEEIQHVENLTFIQGTARFTSSNSIAIDHDSTTQALTADHIVISTGARPRPLDISGLPAERTLTNESLFDLQHLPRHLVIVGAGVIAVELAFAFRKLGIQVTMFALDARPLIRTSQKFLKLSKLSWKKPGLPLITRQLPKLLKKQAKPSPSCREIVRLPSKRLTRY
jgi:pyruvate/2-oxoglutarate dehydrogenase complex dihydrolipoamide dehydrogenase (E3) component